MWKVYLPSGRFAYRLKGGAIHAGLPLRSIIPTIDAPVLTVLAGTTRPMSGRRVAALAGASHPAVGAVLARLTEAGIVTATPQGPSVLYVANRDHLAWPAIEALTRLRGAALDLMRDSIGSWPIAPRTALLFGSFARADGDDSSDIDLLVVQPNMPSGARAAQGWQPRWENQVAELQERVQHATGNHVQVLDEDLGKLRRRVQAADPILDSWRADGLVLAGTATLDEVLLEAVAKERA